MTTENTTQLDIVDIQAAVDIMDYAAEQGAYKGWQIINQVAGVRTRLAGFVAVVAAAQKAEKEAKEAAEAAAAAEAAVEGAPAETTEETDHVLAPGA